MTSPKIKPTLSVGFDSGLEPLSVWESVFRPAVNVLLLRLRSRVRPVEWQPDFDRRIPTIAYELYILPCKFGRQQCAIPVDVFIYLSEVEYRTFGQFPLCAKPVSHFFPGEDFQSPHPVLPTFREFSGIYRLGATDCEVGDQQTGGFTGMLILIACAVGVQGRC